MTSAAPRRSSRVARVALRVSPLLLAAVVVFDARSASAYPQWQFSSGTSRCSQCHFAPAGGGVITGYARDAVGEELSTWQGNGDFLFGLVGLPSWLALGYDGRGAFLQNDVGDPGGARRVFFPMQLDLSARVAFLDSLSISGTVGYRGQARTSTGALAPDNYRPAGGSRVVSREHTVMWRPQALGAYVRAGRMFAPYGLRLAEHTTYVRRDMGFNLLQESYGATLGMVKKDWELHVTGFAPDFVREIGGTEKGAAGMGELRLGEASALGGGFILGFDADAQRHGGGLFAKTYFERIRTLLMAEANLVHWVLDGGLSTMQLVCYAGLTVFPVRGLWLGVYGEELQTDVKVKNTATEALNGQINWFPYPHLEIGVLGRIQAPRGQEAAKMILGQIHIYL